MQNIQQIVFSKVAKAGNVKTWYAKHLGTAKALEIHDRLFSQTLKIAKR